MLLLALSAVYVRRCARITKTDVAFNGSTGIGFNPIASTQGTPSNNNMEFGDNERDECDCLKTSGGWFFCYIDMLLNTGAHERFVWPEFLEYAQDDYRHVRGLHDALNLYVVRLIQSTGVHRTHNERSH